MINQIKSIWFLTVVSLAASRDYLSAEGDRTKLVCGVKAKDKCLEPLRQLLSVKHLAYGKTDQQLNNTCRRIQKVTECLQNLAQLCQTSNDRIRASVEKLWNVHINLQNELCSFNSPFRLRYLKYSACLDRVGKETEPCIHEYNHEMDMIIQEIPHQKLKFGYVHTDSFCCAIEKHTRCTRSAIESKCNQTAADLAEELFRISSGDVTNECSQTDSSWRKCAAVGRRQSIATVVGALLLVLLVISLIN